VVVFCQDNWPPDTSCFVQPKIPNSLQRVNTMKDSASSVYCLSYLLYLSVCPSTLIFSSACHCWNKKERRLLKLLHRALIRVGNTVGLWRLSPSYAHQFSICCQVTKAPDFSICGWVDGASRLGFTRLAVRPSAPRVQAMKCSWARHWSTLHGAGLTIGLTDINVC